MRRIDGGIGGGQVLRWSVAVAAIEQEAVEIVDIRGTRDTPGLRPQHVAAVQAIAEVTDAEVSGLEVGSEEITLEPGPVTCGAIAIDVGTAGSIPLVFDTLLPLVLEMTGPVRCKITGGTDVKWSPPVTYHRQVKLPFLREFGFRGKIEVERRGFYPKGGGQATLDMAPAEYTPIRLTDRGALEKAAIHSLATEDLADADVVTRQTEQAESELRSRTDVPIEASTEYVKADSTGSTILLELQYENSRAGFSALGEPGKPAEDVADTAVEAFEVYRKSAGAVDRHLADQLLPFLAVGGGTITTPESTGHIETAIAVLEEFGYEIDLDEQRDSVRVTANTG